TDNPAVSAETNEIAPNKDGANLDFITYPKNSTSK
ncbi:MAG: hypothetical protein ACI978_000435, partial [Oleispira sp.]